MTGNLTGTDSLRIPRLAPKHWALHDGDAAHGDGAPEEMGLATPPWDDMMRRPTSYEELENGTANTPVASPPSLRATCSLRLLLRFGCRTVAVSVTYSLAT